MWILPKQLHTSAFVVDTQELDWDSKEFSQLCEKSLMWRSKPTQSPTWLRRWKSLSYLQPLSSRTLKPSHSQAFVDAWTSSAAVSRVSLSQLLESVKQAKIQDTCSPTLKMELPPVDHDLFSWRTSKESLAPKCQTEPAFSSMCSQSWKAWVTKQRQEYSQRLKSEQATREKESSSLAWPTPVSMNDGIYVDKNPSRNSLGLATMVAQQWPTPSARDHKGTTKPGERVTASGVVRKYGEQLPDTVMKHWSTPTVSDSKGAYPPHAMTRKDGKSRLDQLQNMVVYPELIEKQWPTPTTQDSDKATKGIRTKHQNNLTAITFNQSQDPEKNNSLMKSHELNPSWVEQLMGLPVGWTDCELAAME